MKSKIKNIDKIERLFKAKELFHKRLSKIPFEEKIKILVRLQKIANDVKSITGKRCKVWEI